MGAYSFFMMYRCAVFDESRSARAHELSTHSTHSTPKVRIWVLVEFGWVDGV